MKKKVSYPKVNNNEGAKQLACGVILEAAKLYCENGTSPQMKGKIIKDLRKNHLINGLTDDLGTHTAEQLELHEKEIANRLGTQNKSESGVVLC
jgi:hypothetical protein